MSFFRRVDSNQRYPRHPETDEVASRVAHKDATAWKVEDEKPQCGTYKGKTQQTVSGISREKEESGFKRSRQDRSTGRKAIDVIQEVKGVGDAHKPEKSQSEVQRTDTRDPEGWAQHQKDKGKEYLAAQLPNWPQLP